MRIKPIWLIVLVLTAFAFGRWATPVKVVTETKIVEVEKKVKDTEREKNKKTTVREVIHPDGTKETVTTIEESTETRKKERDDSLTRTDEKKEVTGERGRTSLSALVGLSSISSPPSFGVAATRPILGPITAGVWALTTPMAGVSLGLTF